jgi:phage-related protein
LVWLHGSVKTPPFSPSARREAGFLLGRIQAGIPLRMPHSLALPVIGERCHELRIVDVGVSWRIVYRIDEGEILIVHVFSKKTRATPPAVIEACRRRLRRYDDES